METVSGIFEFKDSSVNTTLTIEPGGQEFRSPGFRLCPGLKAQHDFIIGAV